MNRQPTRPGARVEPPRPARSRARSIDAPRALAALLVAAAPLAACADAPPADIPEVRSDLPRDLAPDVSPTELATFVDGNTTFAAALYQRAARTTDGNLFLSPHSISIALAMTYAGAGSATAAQLATALSFTLPEPALHAAFNHLDLALASRAEAADADTIPFRLQTANALFGQDGWPFQAPFLDELARHYGAGVRVLDFETQPDPARLTINDWVAARTEDKILDLLPAGSISSATRLVLTNAIYFSAAWAAPFDAARTADRPFHLASGEPVAVPTLHAIEPRPYGAGPGYRAAELPYDGDALSMVVVVPDDLASFEATLDAPTLRAIVDSLAPRTLELSLPKFRFDAPLGLKPILQDLGMTDAFSDAADFSRIDGTRRLHIADVLHKGFVAIDEQGTEAAAATAVIFAEDSGPPEPATLAVDRPFVFFIRDRPTGTILFVGRVVDPR